MRHWLLVLVVLLSSCSAQRRLDRIHARHPELFTDSLTTIRDTITLQGSTVYIDKPGIDSTVYKKLDSLAALIGVTPEQLTQIKYIVKDNPTAPPLAYEDSLTLVSFSYDHNAGAWVGFVINKPRKVPYVKETIIDRSPKVINQGSWIDKARVWFEVLAILALLFFLGSKLIKR